MPPRWRAKASADCTLNSADGGIRVTAPVNADMGADVEDEVAALDEAAV